MASPGFLRSPARYAGFAWGVLAYNVATSAWGAYVRASGSGAGCGNHWPLCNGEVVPVSPTVELLIELTHRSTAGIASLLVLALLVWAFRAYPKGSAVRSGAVASTVMIVCEALMGAALVKLGLVKDDASPGRAVAMGLHLVITFFLLAALTATAYAAQYASAPPHGPRTRPVLPRSPVLWALAAPFTLLVAAATTGAIAALGDTLFHATTLSQGMAQDASATAHLFLRLRALHPLFAGLAAVAVLACTTVVVAMRPGAHVARAARVVRVTVVAQVIAGIANLVLLAPIGMQIVHLVLADTLWIVLVVLGLAALRHTGSHEDDAGVTPPLRAPELAGAARTPSHRGLAR